jgi:hypothetical protein
MGSTFTFFDLCQRFTKCEKVFESTENVYVCLEFWLEIVYAVLLQWLDGRTNDEYAGI